MRRDTWHDLTANWRALAAAMTANQAIDPGNLDDAEYIAAHPRDFSPEMVAQAHRTLRGVRR